MKDLSRSGLRIFVVTNQAIINRGMISPDDLNIIHQRMVATVRAHGVEINMDDISYCPHRPDENCYCRKPKPGMILGLAAEHRIDLSCSYLVGDALTDIMAGRAAGCRTVLVMSGRGAEQLVDLEAAPHRPDHIASDLVAATQWILASTIPPTNPCATREVARG